MRCLLFFYDIEVLKFCSLKWRMKERPVKFQEPTSSTDLGGLSSLWGRENRLAWKFHHISKYLRKCLLKTKRKWCKFSLPEHDISRKQHPPFGLSYRKWHPQPPRRSRTDVMADRFHRVVVEHQHPRQDCPWHHQYFAESLSGKACSSIPL